MATYTSANLKIEFDNATGTLVDMSNYIISTSGLSATMDLDETHAFGDSWVERATKGTFRFGDITLSGLYDDASPSGPNIIFNDILNLKTTAAGTRTLKITWGGSKTSTVETYIKSYKSLPSRGEITKFEVVLSTTGTVTEV